MTRSRPHPDPAPGRGRPPRAALLALALGAFVIGTAELVAIGVLDLVARDTGVSVSTAGQLVTAYALGVCVGGPLLTVATTRVARTTVLRLTLVAYIGGNLVAALAVSFDLVVVARVLTGSVHGLFVGVASVVAASLVPPSRRGMAMSTVFGGIAVATVLGVPLGTLVGSAWGWQAAFAGVVALGCAALVATIALVPPVAARGARTASTQLRAALAPRVLVLLGVGFLVIGAQFTAFTYLAPFLREVTGVSPGTVSLFLLAFGAASAVGTALGGKAADRDPAMTLVVANVALLGALGGVALLGSTSGALAVVLVLWGLVGFGLVPALQLRVVTLAGQGADVAATLGASAVNAGIAVGALVGGWAVDTRGVQSVAVVALVVCALALPLTWASRTLQPEAAPRDDPGTPPAAPVEATA
jgi:DHA1 family inner membrane transport protein